MSLAAVPAYFLARRVVGKWPALLAALLAVAVPSMVYTATVMTENAYYPLFLLAALTLVWLLERPSVARYVAFFVALGLAYLTRSQAIVIAAAAVSAPVLLGLFRPGALRATVWAYRWLYAIFAARSAARRGRPGRPRPAAQLPARRLLRGRSGALRPRDAPSTSSSTTWPSSTSISASSPSPPQSSSRRAPARSTPRCRSSSRSRSRCSRGRSSWSAPSPRGSQTGSRSATRSLSPRCS